MLRLSVHALALAVLALLAGRVEADRLLVDCPDHLRPAITRWADWRRGQGHSVEWYAQANRGEDRRNTEEVDRNVMIVVGDGRVAGTPPGLVPAEVVSQYGPECHLATDHSTAELAGVDVVARLPFTTATSLARFLDRVILREQRAEGWSDQRLQITAGVGNFSPLIDAAIEAAAKRLVVDLSSPRREIRFRRAVEGANPSTQRGGVWVWLGHGLRDRLPGIEPQHLTHYADRADFAVLLACYAGDFAAPGDCVAEQLLKAPDGPIAVIASTRVSMPYGNARFGGELLAALSSQPGVSIGRLFQQARRASVRETADARLAGLDPLASLLGAGASSLPGERRDHAQMYHLLGDPCSVVDRSMPLPLRVASSGPAGGPVTVTGVSPVAGWLRVEVRSRASGQTATANNPRWVTPDEPFELVLNQPSDWRSGSLRVRVGVAGTQGLALGAATVSLDRSKTRVAARRKPTASR